MLHQNNKQMRMRLRLKTFKITMKVIMLINVFIILLLSNRCYSQKLSANRHHIVLLLLATYELYTHAHTQHTQQIAVVISQLPVCELTGRTFVMHRQLLIVLYLFILQYYCIQSYNCEIDIACEFILHYLDSLFFLARDSIVEQYSLPWSHTHACNLMRTILSNVGKEEYTWNVYAAALL